MIAFLPIFEENHNYRNYMRSLIRNELDVPYGISRCL